MKKVLFVISSVRENRIADKIFEQVKAEVKNYPEIDMSVADFKQTPLPLFNSSVIPAADGFAPTDTNVLDWIKKVEHADVVVFLVAEYNHSYTPVVKNAIDWMYKQWINKPVAFISYGWAGGTRATKHLRDIFNSNISAKITEPEANLYFTKDIELDGSPIGESAKKSIRKVIAAVHRM